MNKKPGQNLEGKNQINCEKETVKKFFAVSFFV